MVLGLGGGGLPNRHCWKKVAPSPGQEEEEGLKESKDEEKIVEQRVPTITKAPKCPRVPIMAKKKYPVDDDLLMEIKILEVTTLL